MMSNFSRSNLGASLCAGSLALACASSGTAGELSGHLGLEYRYFPQEPVNPQQFQNYGSVFGELDYFHDWDGGDKRFASTFFFRYDQRDNKRSHVDFRDLYWRKTFADGNADIYVGARRVFWGVAESVHLVDIINQTDFVEDIDGEEKLGQPTVQLAWYNDWGTVDFFYLPYFRERTFHGVAGRPRVSTLVDTDLTQYESDDEERHQDFALRWSHTLGDWDVGVSHFRGTSRDPRFLLGTPNGQNVLIPRYDQLIQTGLDVQFTGDEWLWKLETVSRHQSTGNSSAFVGGFEYTLYDIAETGLDLGLITEYLYDDREAGYVTPFDNDIALGTRFAFNDTNDTEILAIAVIDLDNGSNFDGSRVVATVSAISVSSSLL